MHPSRCRTLPHLMISSSSSGNSWYIYLPSTIYNLPIIIIDKRKEKIRTDRRRRRHQRLFLRQTCSNAEVYWEESYVVDCARILSILLSRTTSNQFFVRRVWLDLFLLHALEALIFLAASSTLLSRTVLLYSICQILTTINHRTSHLFLPSLRELERK